MNESEVRSKETIDLSDEARKLLSNPLLSSSFTKARDKVILNIANSKYDERELREHQYLILTAINEVQSTIRKMIRDGDIERTRMRSKEVPKLKSLDR